MELNQYIKYVVDAVKENGGNSVDFELCLDPHNEDEKPEVIVGCDRENSSMIKFTIMGL